MPKIFQYLSYHIRFYTNDYLPIHVHVQLQRRETKVEFLIAGDDVTLIFKKIKGRLPLTEAEANEVVASQRNLNNPINQTYLQGHSLLT
ncbi:MAG: DUF4160 domain-containing protein [Bacteroidota bacterium]|nr:DUF4160 domain-containing protein [Bacteroidota bacterium]